MKKSTVFTLGALIGGGVALFVTPKSGKELQNELLQRVEELQLKVKEFDQELFKEQCKFQLEELKKRINDIDWKLSLRQNEEELEEITSCLTVLKEEVDEHEKTEEFVSDPESESEEFSSEILSN